MTSRVTIQDIADALGLSRNTVSKAINNTGVLADATRDRILAKAVEMGYKQFSYTNVPDTFPKDLFSSGSLESGEIAVLTTKFLGNSHFASTMMDKFQQDVTQLGFSFTMHRVLPDEIDNICLPASLDIKKTSGIICFEMFHPGYSRMTCGLDIPVLFVYSPVIGQDEPLKADCLYMDNQTNIFLFIKEMLRRGKSRIGFVGEYFHCQSFMERFMAYRNAMFLYGQPYNEEFCILKNKEGAKMPGYADYRAYLEKSLRKITSLPDVFICANDFAAIDLLKVFRKPGVSVPEDVYLCGFDDSPESRIITPALTTIHIHSQIMGFSAVYLLVSRIKEPLLNFRTIYTETSLIYRESTGD